MVMVMAEAMKMIEEREEKEKSAAVEGRRFLCELPADVQRLISSFLNASDSVIFRRCISKSLTSNLLSSPISRRMMMNMESCPLPQAPELPYLLSLHEGVFKFHHPLMSGFYSVEVPELSESRIRFQHHGWLLMHDDAPNVFFFEPFSRQKIVLPQCPETRCPIASMCFNLPPTSPNCFVISFELGGMDYYITRPGEESWTLRCFKGGQHFYFCPTVTPVIHNGLCYCLSQYGYLGVFNPQEKNPAWTVFGKSYSDMVKDSLVYSFLLEKNKNELLRVSVVGDDRKIVLSTFNVRKKAWRLGISLKDKVLFLSTNGSFSESIDLRGMRNKIYFPKLYNGASIFYSISAERYLSFQEDYSSKICSGDGVKDFSCNSLWFKPILSGNTIHHLPL